ncbi:MAG: hypothetical protein U9P68_07130 [Pseudomonadota bacterium]|nr:hypothetical protein [Pseudomonadota bacterium]
MSVLRIATLVVSAVSGGVVIGRKLLADQVQRKKAALVERAGAEVRERIRTQARGFVIDHLRRFSIALVIKAGMLIGVVALERLGVLPGWLYGAMLLALITAFVARDVYVSWPTLSFAARELRKNGWRPRLTVAEIVAAQTFDEVLAESSQQPQLWHEDLLLALAGEKRDKLVEDIANEVAAIARGISWPTLKPYFLTGVVMTAGLSALYGAFAWLALHGLVI